MDESAILEIPLTPEIALIEEPLRDESPRNYATMIFAIVIIGFLVIACAQFIPSTWPRLKVILDIIGCLMLVPVLCLFFYCYHQLVPKIFVHDCPRTPGNSDDSG
jgi:hypothetical protein